MAKTTRQAKSVDKAMQDKEIITTLMDELCMNANGLSKKLDYKSPTMIYRVVAGEENITEEMSLRFKKYMPWVNTLFIDKGKLPIILMSQDEMKIQQHIFGLSKGKKEHEPNDYLEAIIESRDLMRKIAAHLGVK